MNDFQKISNKLAHLEEMMEFEKFCYREKDNELKELNKLIESHKNIKLNEKK